MNARADGMVAEAFAQAVVRLHRQLVQLRGDGGGGGDGREAGDAGIADDSPRAAASDEQVLAHWAQRIWKASADGHACVAIDDSSQRERLAASPAVAGGEPAGEPAPLVLDGDALYLQRLWRAESVLAGLLVALDAPAPLADAAALAQALDEVAPPERVDALQRAAIEAALSRRLAIVTGGPGTGKTTTMARLLVAFSRLAPAARIAIAAPTGKAAARLSQALAAQLEVLDPDGELAARLPAAGLTVHRLLGLRGEGSRPADDAARFDLVIVDEASMLDLELARGLVESIPAGGRLVLAGDRDQLASVEAGAVFAEACASRLDGVVRLQRNYRQADAPALTELAAWLRDRCLAPSGAAAPPFDSPAGVECRAPAGAGPIAAQAVAAWEPALAALTAGEPAAAVIAAFERHRVLCAMRDGPTGVLALNDAIAARVRRRVGARPGAVWYPGRIVIVTRNRPELGLSNGDVGVCLPDPAAPPGAPAVAGAWAGTSADASMASERVPLSVVFGSGGELRWMPARQMPAHDDAFAITVHKSQGSEFQSVALVPAPRGHRLNTRELLYTGATRASSRLTVWAEPGALDDGARQRTERHGRLADRIAALVAPLAGKGGPR
jgi:exodeoxyribonuclease V alpha subunit